MFWVCTTTRRKSSYLYVGTKPPEGELSSEQHRILEAVLKGENLFYTGPAGTGKSFMLEHTVYHLRQLRKTVFLTAPTGFLSFSFSFVAFGYL